MAEILLLKAHSIITQSMNSAASRKWKTTSQGKSSTRLILASGTSPGGG